MIRMEVAPGELVDKITILEIKLAQIEDPKKRANVRHELELLERVRDKHVASSPELTRLTQDLKQINSALWFVEDELREHERVQKFDHTFIELARSVYKTNDRRAVVKRRINELLNSSIFEEKSYTVYE